MKRDSTNSVPKYQDYDAGNLRAANIILCQVARHGGEEAGIVRWARAVIKRLAPKPVTPPTPAPTQLSLFP